MSMDDIDNLENLRNFDDEESKKLLRDVLSRLVKRQLDYANALCEYKSTIGDILRDNADSDDFDIDDQQFVKLSLAGSDFAISEHALHESARLCSAMVSDSKSDLSVHNIHCIFMLGTSPAMRCVESYVAFNQQLTKVFSGTASIETINDSREAINSLGDEYLSITEEYIQTLRFIIDDRRTIN